MGVASSIDGTHLLCSVSELFGLHLAVQRDGLCALAQHTSAWASSGGLPSPTTADAMVAR